MDVYLALLFCSLAALVMYAVDRIFSGNRIRELQEQARQLGLSFRAKGDPFANTAIHGLTLIERDPASIVSNLIEGIVRGFNVTIFDLGHCDESSPVVMYTTVAAFRCPSGCLPVLDLQLRTLEERLEELLHRRSSERKLCAGGILVEFEDKAQALQFLSDDKMQKLCLHPEHFRIETSHDWLLFFVPGARVKPRSLRSFVDLAVDIAVTLMDAKGRMPAAPASARA